MNNFCTNCGAKMELGLKFCTECGQARDESDAPPNSGTDKTASPKVAEAPKFESKRPAPTGAPAEVQPPPRPQSNPPSAGPTRAYAQPSPTREQAYQPSSKRNFIVIGLIAAVIVGGAGYLLVGKTSPSTLSSGKTEKTQPSFASTNQSRSRSANSSDPALAAVKLPDTAETLKLVMAMVDATMAKDEGGLQKALDAIKRMPVPRRGDRSIARAANAAGLTRLQANEPSEAVASFREGMAADPSDAEIVNNLGYALSLAGKETEALEAFARAISLAPDRTSAWANLAVSFGKTNQMDKGVASYLLAYRFSKSQDKTRAFLIKQSEEARDERERDLSQRVLKALDQP